MYCKDKSEIDKFLDSTDNILKAITDTERVSALLNYYALIFALFIHEQNNSDWI